MKRLSKEEERELARYYEENRDNPAIWGPAIPVAPRRGTGPSTVFSLRLTGEELTLFWREANRRGITVSELIREAALKEVAEASSDEADLKQAADSLRRIAGLIERQASASGAPRPALKASEERSEYRAETSASEPVRKRAARRPKA